METRLTTHLGHSDETRVVYRPPEDLTPEPVIVIRDNWSGMIFIKPESMALPAAINSDHVRFARELVEASQAYLAELERAFEHDQRMEEAA